MDLIKYRMRTERYVHPVAETTLSTKFGDFRMIAYESMIDGETHIALVKGNIGDGEPVMVDIRDPLSEVLIALAREVKELRQKLVEYTHEPCNEPDV